MFTGCPVIATIYSGQSDLCAEDRCWPVEYEIEPARTHLTAGASVWANPLVDSLREQMRSVYRASAAERRQRTDRARQFVQDRVTWQQVAERHWRCCTAALELKQQAAPPRFVGSTGVGFVTTWNTRCG